MTHPQVAPYIVLVAASLSVGYWAGIKSRTSVSNPAPPKTTKAESLTTRDVSSGHDSESETSEAGGDLRSLQIHPTEECKMVGPIENVFVL